MPVCGGCAEISPAGARYCGSCGTRLTDYSRAARRTVTVLFSDISGFTGLAEGLDPEPLRILMAKFYDEMADVVRRHGGTTARFIGDAVMAVFGIPQLHEDDAVRAVHAALEMQEKVELLNEEFERDWGVRIQVCTGVNTGEVATSDVSLHDALVVGDAVNVAARLQQAAPPGGILVGPGTSRLVRGSVRVEELQPLAVKGRGATVTASRVLGLDATVPGRTGRPVKPLVGRDPELEHLRRVFGEVAEQRSCRLVTVVGEAGIGKSQLVSEFTRRLDDRATVLYGFCEPYGEQSPLAPVAEIVRQGAGLRADEGVTAARSRLLALLEGLEDREALVAHLLSVLGLVREGGSGPDEMAWGTRKLLEALSAERPLVAVLDDLHRASPTLLSVVQHVRDWSRDAPIMLLCLTRSELVESDAWSENPARATSISLVPLTREDSSRLVGALLDGEPVAPKALARIADAAQGNPLYLEEILSTLCDEGVLRPQNGRWILTRDTPAITAPPPIQALLAARLDRLSPDRRLILETASVIGNTLSLEVLRALLPPELDEGLEDNLRWLAEHAFAAERPTESTELQFHHVLLREAAYAGLAKETRARLHERFADWLQTSRGNGVTADDDALIGHHLEQASRYLAELRPVDDHAARLARLAGERLGATGCRSFASGDMPGAATVLSRAVSLLAPDDALSLSLLPTLAEALMSTGELGRATEVAEDALRRARVVGHRQVEARGVLIRSIGRLFTDPEGGAEALHDVRTILPALEEARDEVGLAKAWHLLSMAEIAQSHFTAAEAAMERAAAHAHRSGDRRQELEILSWIPLPIWIGPRPAEEGIGRCEEILERAAGDPKVEAMVSLMLGAQEAMLGRFDDARHSVARARTILEDLGLRLLIAGTSQVAGWIDLLSGDFAGAERELSAGYAALEEMGETGLLSTLAGWWAQALYELGRDEEAERTAELGETMAGETDCFSLALGRAVRSKVLARRGQFDAAEQLGRDAVALAERTDSPQLIGDVMLDLSSVEEMAGKRVEAAELAMKAMQQFDQKGNLVALVRAQRAHDAA